MGDAQAAKCPVTLLHRVSVYDSTTGGSRIYIRNSSVNATLYIYVSCAVSGKHLLERALSYRLFYGRWYQYTVHASCVWNLFSIGDPYQEGTSGCKTGPCQRPLASEPLVPPESRTGLKMLVLPATPLTVSFASSTQQLGIGARDVPTQLDPTGDGAACTAVQLRQRKC